MKPLLAQHDFVRYSRYYLLFVVLMIFSVNFSFAQSNWDGGAGTNNWSDADNWDPNGVPGDGDDVIIGPGDSVVVNVAVENINDLIIQEGGILNITTGGSLEAQTEGFIFGDAADATISGTLYLTGGNLSIDDDVSVSGENAQIIIESGTLDVSDEVFISNDATVTVESDGMLEVGRTLELDNGHMIVSGTVENTSNFFNITEDIEMNGSSTLTLEEGADVSFSDLRFGDDGGTSTVTINGGSLQLDQDLDFSGGQDGDQLVINDGVLDVGDEVLLDGSNGDLEVNGGTVIADNIDGNSLPYFYDDNSALAVDTVIFNLVEDNELEFCLSVFDAEADPYNISLDNISSTIGSISASESGEDCYLFNPVLNTTDTVYFEATVCDQNFSSLCNDVMVALAIEAVNDAPYVYKANAGEQADTVEFVTKQDSTISICVNVFDVEEDSYTVNNESLINSSGLLSEGSEENCFSYEPSPDFLGTDYFKVVVCDEADPTLCSDAVVKISVLEFIDNSTIKLDTIEISIDEDVKTDFCLDFSSINEALYEVSSYSLVKETGTINNSEDLCFEYTSDSNFNGEDQLNLTICEKSNSSNCLQGVVKLTIDPVNDAPYIYNSDSSIYADTISIGLSEDDMSIFELNVNDPENDDYSISYGVTTEESSTLSGASSSFTYVPAEDFNGNDFVTFSVCDVNNDTLCTSTVIKFVVAQVNDAPKIVIGDIEVDSLYFGTDINVAVDVCLNAEDIDGDVVSISSVESDFNFGRAENISGLCFDYVPNTDVTGLEELQVIICDNATEILCDTISVKVEFPSQNTPPVFIFDGKTVDTLTFSISEGQIISECMTVWDRELGKHLISDIESQDTIADFSATLDDNLCLTYQPSGAVATDTIKVNVCDQGDNSVCSQLVGIVEVNGGPNVILNDSLISESIYLRALQNTSIDTCFDLFDINDDLLLLNSLELASGSGLLNGSVDNQNARLCLSYFTQLDSIGMNTFFLELCDNGMPSSCTSVNVNVEVFPFNSAPTLSTRTSDTIHYTINENESFSDCLSLMDAEGDSIFISNVSSPENGGLLDISLDETGVCLDYTAEEYHFGVYEATLSMCDDNAFSLCSDMRVIIDILPVNSAPITVEDTLTVYNESGIWIQLLSNDQDVENEPIKLDTAFEILPLYGEITERTDSSIFYVPNYDFNGQIDEFIYSVCDEGVPTACSEGIVSIKLQLPFGLIIYDAFSPNADGFNDQWIIEGISEYANNSVRIFDQWNNEVYQAVGYDNSMVVWEGDANNGSQLSNGTYYYVIDLGDGSETLSGFVVLRR